MIYKPPVYLASIICCFLLSGCASILTSSNQELSVKPTGTSLEVYSWDGKLLASTKNPSETTVSVHKPIRGQSYLVIAKAANKCPKYWLTAAKESPASYGNLLLGGIIGLIIDSHTGAGWLVDPDTYELNVAEGAPCAK
jgi:hypothetical protein